MDTPVLTIQQKFTFTSPVQTLDVVLRTYQEQWLIGTDNKRENQGDPCCQHILIMMMNLITLVYLFNNFFLQNISFPGVSHQDIVTNALDCNIVVSMF